MAYTVGADSQSQWLHKQYTEQIQKGVQPRDQFTGRAIPVEEIIRASPPSQQQSLRTAYESARQRPQGLEQPEWFKRQRVSSATSISYYIDPKTGLKTYRTGEHTVPEGRVPIGRESFQLEGRGEITKQDIQQIRLASQLQQTRELESTRRIKELAPKVGFESVTRTPTSYRFTRRQPITPSGQLGQQVTPDDTTYLGKRYYPYGEATKRASQLGKFGEIAAKPYGEKGPEFLYPIGKRERTFEEKLSVAKGFGEGVKLYAQKTIQDPKPLLKLGGTALIIGGAVAATGFTGGGAAPFIGGGLTGLWLGEKEYRILKEKEKGTLTQAKLGKITAETMAEGATFVAGAKIGRATVSGIKAIMASKSPTDVKLEKIRNLYQRAATSGEKAAAKKAYVKLRGSEKGLEVRVVGSPRQIQAIRTLRSKIPRVSIDRSIPKTKAIEVAITKVGPKPTKAFDLKIIRPIEKPSKAFEIAITKVGPKPSKAFDLKIIKPKVEPTKGIEIEVTRVGPKPTKAFELTIERPKVKPTKMFEIEVTSVGPKPSKAFDLKIIRPKVKPSRLFEFSIITKSQPPQKDIVLIDKTIKPFAFLKKPIRKFKLAKIGLEVEVESAYFRLRDRLFREPSSVTLKPEFKMGRVQFYSRYKTKLPKVRTPYKEITFKEIGYMPISKAEKEAYAIKLLGFSSRYDLLRRLAIQRVREKQGGPIRPLVRPSDPKKPLLKPSEKASNGLVQILRPQKIETISIQRTTAQQQKPKSVQKLKRSSLLAFGSTQRSRQRQRQNQLLGQILGQPQAQPQLQEQVLLSKQLQAQPQAALLGQSQVQVQLQRQTQRQSQTQIHKLFFDTPRLQIQDIITHPPSVPIGIPKLPERGPPRPDLGNSLGVPKRKSSYTPTLIGTYALPKIEATKELAQQQFTGALSIRPQVFIPKTKRKKKKRKKVKK